MVRWKGYWWEDNKEALEIKTTINASFMGVRERERDHGRMCSFSVGPTF
jgi:hypothetical protein